MKWMINTSLILALLIPALSFGNDNFITVYNKDLALVKQVRVMKASSGAKLYQYTDVAAKLIPTSVHIRPVKPSQAFAVIEQNFEYDLVSSEKILEKYIDHLVEIITESGDLIKGVLLSKSGGSLVLKTENSIRIVPWSNRLSISVKDLPQGLITKPTLVWELSGVDPAGEKLEVSYLTRGMEWHAEYVGVINADGTRLLLDAWVSVKNRSGTSFPNARLKLVAGDIHRVQDMNQRQKAARAKELMMMADAAPGFEERAFFEYHMYELARTTTLKQNQTKQIALFPPATLTSEKQYVFNASKNPKKVAVKLIFENKKKNGLGRPLPAGVFRIFQEDGNSLEFTGEDRMDHTGRNETVNLTMGHAFDIAAERKVMNRTKVSKRSRRETIEIELRNNKLADDVVILVEESMDCRNWEIEKFNFSPKKKDAATVQFTVPVKNQEKTLLKYTVLCSW